MPLDLEAGIGVRGIGVSTKIRTATASDSEDVFAVAVPYLELGARVTLTPRLSVRAELQDGAFSIPVPPEPAQAHFLSTKLLADLRLVRNLSLQAGFVYFAPGLRFHGTEGDGDRADNRADLSVLGGTIGVNLRF